MTITRQQAMMLLSLRAGKGPMAGAWTPKARGGRKHTLASCLRLGLLAPAPRTDANPHGVALTEAGREAVARWRAARAEAGVQ